MFLVNNFQINCLQPIFELVLRDFSNKIFFFCVMFRYAVNVCDSLQRPCHKPYLTRYDVAYVEFLIRYNETSL